jgi:hypothetical protein
MSEQPQGRDVGNGRGDAPRPDADAADRDGTMAGTPSGGLLTGMTTMSGINDENIAAEAASEGLVDGALADDAGDEGRAAPDRA